jgi:hypothetical protein
MSFLFDFTRLDSAFDNCKLSFSALTSFIGVVIFPIKIKKLAGIGFECSFY